MTGDKGDKQEFVELLDTHRKLVFKVANLYCRLQQDRDDLAQEIVSQLWRSYASYDPARNFSTWMYRIALNVAISQLRARKRNRVVMLDLQLHDLSEQSATTSERQACIDELHRFIDQLEPLNRALMLLYLEERSYGEIAEILGITETNVATKISRLKARLAKQINTEE